MYLCIYLCVYLSIYLFIFIYSRLTLSADTAVTAVIGAGWCLPPPPPLTVLDRAQTRSLLRLGASAD